ncbi:hypothetical protein L596_020277 [Steinernema carpocapsae]|uniref:G-protein coupled receptors family 1 profile domain-containing protein n=1 Tax=Steinernema carpocapsae TaxID=34508 RepID=A0A4U5MT26_STECR|nr:hypothetical protein L596_020277 [Steinernema carpocapsae]
MSFPISFDLVSTYLNFISTTDEKIVCRLPDGMTGTAINFWIGSQVFIALIVLILYMLVRHELRKMTCK